MNQVILDASALLALLNMEQGSNLVANAILEGAVISSVNLSEVVVKLSEAGMPETVIHEVLDVLNIEIVPFNSILAYEAGMLRPLTRHAGLSLGDRACLALAKQRGLAALTTDRAWTGLAMDILIQVIR